MSSAVGVGESLHDFETPAILERLHIDEQDGLLDAAGQLRGLVFQWPHPGIERHAHLEALVDSQCP